MKILLASALLAGGLLDSSFAQGIPGSRTAVEPTAPDPLPESRVCLRASQDTSADPAHWSVWWELNREPYLDLKTEIQSGAPTPDGAGWVYGGPPRQDGGLAPTDRQIREQVVPALIAALEGDADADMDAACLIALAKIGDSPCEQILAQELASPVHEIAATAVVALGIQANPASVPTLASLLADDAAGRALLGAAEVDLRMRAFAAYGLGLIGALSGDEPLRREIVGHLHRALETDQTESCDLGAACVIALGLVPLETIEAFETRESWDRDATQSNPSTSRSAQMDYLLSYLADTGNSGLTRAHVPTGLARLLDHEYAATLPDELHASFKARIAEQLLASSAAGEIDEVVQSCVIALGMIGDADADELDVRIRAKLAAVASYSADQQARYYALIAMAKVGGKPGNGDAEEGWNQVSKVLLDHLSRPPSTRPWAGLAIGVLCNELRQRGEDPTVTVVLKDALRTKLREERDEQNVGAYAIGVGLAGDQESKTLLLAKLASPSADEPRGHVAVALGLLGDRDAIAPLRRIVSASKYRPELLRQAAIGLGLLGDKELVTELVTMLNDATGIATQAAIASALGRIGDQRSIDPLVAMLQNKEVSAPARAFAAVALGIVVDKERLPWDSKIGVDLNYRASTTTLNDQNGTGILNIL